MPNSERTATVASNPSFLPKLSKELDRYDFAFRKTYAKNVSFSNKRNALSLNAQKRLNVKCKKDMNKSSYYYFLDEYDLDLRSIMIQNEHNRNSTHTS